MASEIQEALPLQGQLAFKCVAESWGGVLESVSHTTHLFILHSSDLIEQHFSVLMEAETSFGDVPWARRNLLEKGQAPETIP